MGFTANFKLNICLPFTYTYIIIHLEKSLFGLSGLTYDLSAHYWIGGFIMISGIGLFIHNKAPDFVGHVTQNEQFETGNFLYNIMTGRQ
jgi:hypothetical protein